VSLVPDQATFRQLAQTSDLIPVCLDLMADLETPVSVYARLRTLGEAFLFESVTGGEHIGRYSFCGASPALTITSWEDRTEIVRRGGGKETVPTPADPLTLVKREVAGLRVAKVPGLPPFVGGMVGMVGYEYVHRVEPTVPRAAKESGRLSAHALHAGRPRGRLRQRPPDAAPDRERARRLPGPGRRGLRGRPPRTGGPPRRRHGTASPPWPPSCPPPPSSPKGRPTSRRPPS